jgi:hypothetical protein
VTVAILKADTIAAIKARKPARQPWVFTYKTRGGTYVLANDGTQSDSGKPRDLLALDLFGKVVVLSPLTSPGLIAEFTAAVEA